MTTHAHRFTPQLIDALAGAVNFVRVSVDGVGTTYEKLRGRPFSDLVQRLTWIGQTFRFGLNCVVNADTLPDLDAVADLAASTGSGTPTTARASGARPPGKRPADHRCPAPVGRRVPGAGHR